MLPNPRNSTVPPDDIRRQLVIARPDDANLRHVAVVGDTYTILVSGKDTAGRYALIDMLVPPGGGPPLHRHDFEEMFYVFEGEIEVTFRGASSMLSAGETVAIPANAPHAFRNVSAQPARLLATVSPAGLEEFFVRVGAPMPSRTAPAPALDTDAMAAFLDRANALAPDYRIENLPPSDASMATVR
jgi:quercetin dioxygenase-like cupin family protein